MPISPQAAASTTKALERAFFAADEPHTADLVLNAALSGRHEVLAALAGHPLEEDWREHVENSLAKHFAEAKGIVYVVVNPAQPKFHKVGKTGQVMSRRLAQLDNEAVVGEFLVVTAWEVPDRHRYEALAHQALAEYPRHKEFFVADWKDVCEKVEARFLAIDTQFAKSGIACATAKRLSG